MHYRAVTWQLLVPASTEVCKRTAELLMEPVGGGASPVVSSALPGTARTSPCRLPVNSFSLPRWAPGSESWLS